MRLGSTLSTCETFTRKPGEFRSIDEAGTEAEAGRVSQLATTNPAVWLRVLPAASVQFTTTVWLPPEAKDVLAVYLMVVLGSPMVIFVEGEAEMSAPSRVKELILVILAGPTFCKSTVQSFR